MNASTQWQLERSAAERYQDILTPAILGPFARALVDLAALQDDERVLDVGCGTGAAAKYAAEALGPGGHVTGLDVNASMIEVARSLPAVRGAPIEWHQANAAQLPFADQNVDVVLCAQTLQFLPKKETGLSEMQRVLKTSGRAVLSVWCNIGHSPYFRVLAETIEKYIGPETSSGLKSAFVLSDAKVIHRLLEAAGFGRIDLETTQLDLQLPDLQEFVPRHITATPMAAGYNRAPQSVRHRIIQEVREKLSRYRQNGKMQIPFKSYMFTCRK